MESLEQEKYYFLGKKTLFIFLMRRTGLGIFFWLLALIVLISKSALSSSDIIIKLSSGINWVMALLFGAGLVILAGGVGVAFSEYNTSRIMFDDVGFHVVRGIFSKHEIVIPYRRIQSVETEQSLFYRTIGLGHVIIVTTTSLEEPSEIKTERNEEVISVMDYPLAKLIEKTLISRAEIERMEIGGIRK